MRTRPLRCKFCWFQWDGSLLKCFLGRTQFLTSVGFAEGAPFPSDSHDKALGSVDVHRFLPSITGFCPHAPPQHPLPSPRLLVGTWGCSCGRAGGLRTRPVLSFWLSIGGSWQLLSTAGISLLWTLNSWSVCWPLPLRGHVCHLNLPHVLILMPGMDSSLCESTSCVSLSPNVGLANTVTYTQQKEVVSTHPRRTSRFSSKNLGLFGLFALVMSLSSP